VHITLTSREFRKQKQAFVQSYFYYGVSKRDLRYPACFCFRSSRQVKSCAHDRKRDNKFSPLFYTSYTCPVGILATIAARPAAAGRQILAVDCVATSCCHCREDNCPVTVPLRNRLQEHGAQLYARPGALSLARGPRESPPPIARHEFGVTRGEDPAVCNSGNHYTL
jgi:hypothetical protein